MIAMTEIIIEHVDITTLTGGDIGKLAVTGTVNDLAVGGAIPLYLTCGMIIEECLPGQSGPGQLLHRLTITSCHHRHHRHRLL